MKPDGKSVSLTFFDYPSRSEGPTSQTCDRIGSYLQGPVTCRNVKRLNPLINLAGHSLQLGDKQSGWGWGEEAVFTLLSFNGGVYKERSREVGGGGSTGFRGQG